jgi:methionine biosynthesis protein MetW
MSAKRGLPGGGATAGDVLAPFSVGLRVAPGAAVIRGISSGFSPIAPLSTTNVPPDQSPHSLPESIYAGLVAAHGLSDSHRLVLAAVPDGARVLDVGCASGYLAQQLERRGCVVTGLEPNPQAAAAARAHCVTVLEGDVEQAETRTALPDDQDAVVFADVLEHLRDPLGTLAFAKTLLAPGGRAVISLPNIAHWTGRRAVVRGRFPYADHGLFDRTHLRFFTRESAHALGRDAGFEVTEERFTTAPLPLEGPLRARFGGDAETPSPPLAGLRRALSRRWPEMFALQVVLTLRPAPDAAEPSAGRWPSSTAGRGSPPRGSRATAQPPPGSG